MERGKTLGIPVVRPLPKPNYVTAEDLQEFKKELLVSIKALIASMPDQPSKRWLKTYEVMEILNLSAGTLQTLRNNGIIPFSKIGGILYYDADEINKVIEQQKGSPIAKYKKSATHNKKQ
ncbi:helix-turn-helix domain-containing protein [Paraflavitalea sp. CAU 1676]|uniref:helix-turn-helix domain-containing protein n=1 Tax=Paraflavitalea sp. CAU 1676 TaxID=3032598 RepID=UPI0023DA484F|nr:helix-turn-helix domain-containing protein [Paraflavitalea sp. CAU 1676]MDF2190553.1 helix-turn-helix domain-containing protein [Paraflavitalea sp. CAU 1676]